MHSFLFELGGIKCIHRAAGLEKFQGLTNAKILKWSAMMHMESLAFVKIEGNYRYDSSPE